MTLVRRRRRLIQPTDYPAIAPAVDEHHAAADADPAGVSSFSAPGLRVEQVPIERLLPDPANPRRITEVELEALTRSIRAFGFVEPVLARRRTRALIGGHQRIAAARRLGLELVPVIWLDISAAQARLLGIALNKIGGSFDEQLLARLLAELQNVPDLDVSLSGFGEQEIGDLIRNLDVRDKRERPESFDLDAALEAATRAPRTQPGDAIRMGTHVLRCGDATEPADLASLLAGRRADLAVGDPPYNIAYRGGHGPTAKARRPIANDDLDPVAWEAFVRAWARNLLPVVEGALYIFMSSKELPLVSRVLAEEGGHWSDTLIWSKRGAFTLGRADYQHGYEPVWYGWREGSAHHWCGDRDQSDVWEIARQAASPLSPRHEAPAAPRADDREQQPARRPRPRRLRRLGFEPDRRRTDGAGLGRHGARSCLLRCHRRSLGDLHRRRAELGLGDRRDERRGPPMSARGCPAICRDGRPCRATPQRDAAWCFFHDPGHAEELAEARRLGGLRRRRDRTLAEVYDFTGLGDAESIRRLLEIAAFDTFNLDASVARVRALIATAGAATKLLEIGELAERIAALEAAYASPGPHSTEPEASADDLDELGGGLEP